MSRSDSSTSSSPPRSASVAVGQVEQVQLLVDGQVERLQAAAALQPQPGGERAPHVDGLVVAPLQAAGAGCPPASAKLSSPSRWTSPGSRAASTSSPSGGILATSTSREHRDPALKTSILAAVAPGFVNELAQVAGQLLQERRARRQRPHAEVLGQRRPQVGERLAHAQVGSPAGPGGRPPAAGRARGCGRWRRRTGRSRGRRSA